MSDRKLGAGGIAEDIIRQIRAGALMPGQKLPPRRKLADDYDVSETTIYRALLLLAWSGWTIGHQGKEVRVADRPPIDRPGPETPEAPP